jgi:hypothetical protein
MKRIVVGKVKLEKLKDIPVIPAIAHPSPVSLE